jgi:hypothetical protein
MAMDVEDKRAQEILRQIAALLRGSDVPACPEERAGKGHRRGHGHPAGGCTIRQLPARLLHDAARTAIKINPVNAPVFGRTIALATDAQLQSVGIAKPLAIAVVVGKYWGPTPRQFTVSFMEPSPQDFRDRVLSHMNAWDAAAAISFVETQGDGDVRISTGPGGYWSYLGTDILHVPKDQQTMNLEGFSMDMPESEYRRVVRHETGHTMGFPHEHMRAELVARIDPQKAYDYFLRTQGWDRETVDEQVLTPLDKRSIMDTPPDQDSIMCYQLPGSITKDGKPIRGGVDIDQTDYAFAGKIYPKAGATPQAEGTQAAPADYEHDWGPAKDVQVAA